LNPILGYVASLGVSLRLSPIVNTQMGDLNLEIGILELENRGPVLHRLQQATKN
jgi:hypothetical protein